MKASALADLLYPQHCVFCRKIIATSYLQICDDCAVKLAQPPKKRKGDFFSVCVSALPYEGAVRKAILSMKMGARQSYTTTLGRLLAAQIRQQMDGTYDIITWVPVSERRRMMRGFDQSRLIAKTVAAELKLPALRLLRKKRQNRTQSSIHDVAVRRSNVLNVFRAVHKNKLNGKRMILIDDVITSGATLSECSKVLLLAGAARVDCATVAATNTRQ